MSCLKQPVIHGASRELACDSRMNLMNGGSGRGCRWQKPHVSRPMNALKLRSTGYDGVPARCAVQAFRPAHTGGPEGQHCIELKNALAVLTGDLGASRQGLEPVPRSVGAHGLRGCAEKRAIFRGRIAKPTETLVRSGKRQMEHGLTRRELDRSLELAYRLALVAAPVERKRKVVVRSGIVARQAGRRAVLRDGTGPVTAFDRCLTSLEVFDHLVVTPAVVIGRAAGHLDERFI